MPPRQPQPPGLRISPDDVRERKQVGSLNGDSVFHLQTKGGYNIFAAVGKSGPTILGVGAHPAVAKFMAQKAHPNMLLTQLSKSAFHQLEQPEIDAMLPDALAVMRLIR